MFSHFLSFFEKSFLRSSETFLKQRPPTEPVFPPRNISLKLPALLRFVTLVLAAALWSYVGIVGKTAGYGEGEGALLLQMGFTSGVGYEASNHTAVLVELDPEPLQVRRRKGRSAAAAAQ